MTNIIDKYYEIIGVINPEKALRYARSRQALKLIRNYDAAKPNRTTSGYKRKNSRASDEVSSAHRKLAGGAQDLVRNTALGIRIKAAIASNIVGTGIKPDHIGGPKRKAQHHKDTFKAWAESTACDYEGHYNFYGLQWLWAATIAESGGVFVRQIVNNALAFPLVLQTLEQQYLDDTKNTSFANNEIINGIEYTPDGKIHGYWLYSSLVSNRLKRESRFYSANEIIHIFWKDRPGQHLGVSWLHAVANLIDQRQEWRDAVLLQQRIAACFGVIIKEPPGDMGLAKTGGKAIRDAEGLEYTEMEPGMIAYTDSTTEVTTVTPPNLSHTTGFNSEVVQDIAVGVGLTREQLTGDFSKVTWASGRLARGEFYTNLDRWQQFMMIPALNRVHDWFDNLYTIKHGKIDVARNWIVPHRSAVNPKEELDVDIKKVRSCAMTPQQFSAKNGIKFEEAIIAWREAKELWGDLPFDHDPSRYSSAGNQIESEEKNAEPTDDTKA